MRALIFLLLGHGGLAVNMKAATDAAAEGKFTQVIAVLQNLVNQLQEEASADEGLYNSFKCYCKTNKEATALQIDQDKSDADKLQAAWKAEESKSAERAAEVEEHDKAIGQLNLQLEDARARRKTENEEYMTTQAALKEDGRQVLDAINAIAVRVPGGVPAGWNAEDILESFVQGGPGKGGDPEEIAANYFGKHSDTFKGLAVKYLDQESEDDLSDAIEAIGGEAISFVQQPIEASTEQILHSIEGAGGVVGMGLQTVIGYLAGMRDSINKEMADSAEEEKIRETSFNELQTALQSQMTNHQSTMNKKKMQSAEDAVSATGAKGDFEANQRRISSAQAFLDELVASCDKKAADYNELKVRRQQEATAATRAMEVLQGARQPETTLSTSFMETSSRQEPEKIDKQTAKAVVSALQGKVSSKAKQVSMLTYMLKTTNMDFSGVLKVVENLLQELRDEQDRDDQHLSNCKINLETASDEEADYTSESDRLGAFIGTEEATIQEAEDTIEALKKENADFDEETKSANRQREKERDEYDKVLAEKNEQIQTVEAAVRLLRSVYEATAAVQEDEWVLPESFVQIKEHTDAEQAPEAPGPHKLKGAGFDAIAMLAELENDFKLEVGVLQADEQNAIREFQKLVADLGQSEQANLATIAQKNYEKAESQSRLGEFKVEQEQAQEKLAAAKKLHDTYRLECDNFVHGAEQASETGYEKRKRLRRNDIDNLVRAKAILGARR